jgi:hypothetical protein
MFFGIEVSRSWINGRVSRPRQNQFERRYAFTNRLMVAGGKPLRAPQAARRKIDNVRCPRPVFIMEAN